MSLENVQLCEKDVDFVSSDTPDKQYSIVLGGGDPERNGNKLVIPVTCRRQIELLLLCLGEEANVVLDDKTYQSYSDICDWLNQRTYSEIFTQLKWSYREEDEVIDIIDKIPLPGSLGSSFLKIHPQSLEPERINKEYVHKVNKDSVLISKPYRCGNMYYFNGFKNSAEFAIDHHSDHLEGIIIFEVARQAGIASAHLEGMPLSGAIVILKTTARYLRFIECDEPYLVRTIPAYKQKGGVGFCVYQIIQKGRSCVVGYFSVIAYNSKNAYHKFRNSRAINRRSNEKLMEIQSIF